jgi:hypothetical protein
MGKTLWSSILDDLPDPTHRTWATPVEIATARQNIQDENFQIGNAIDSGDLIVDRNAATSRAERGLWVSGWIWVHADEVDGEGWHLPLPDAANDVVEEACVSGAFDIEEDAP